MGYVPVTPNWVYEALVTEPKPEKPTVHWSIKIAPVVVSLEVGLILLAAYLTYKGVPF